MVLSDSIFCRTSNTIFVRHLNLSPDPDGVARCLSKK